MKKAAILLIVLVLLSFTEKKAYYHAQEPEPSIATANDKEFLLNYLQETFQNLQKNIEGLSEKQLQFKVSEEEWSVSQCIEHIILTEEMLLEMTKELLAQPANPRAERRGCNYR